MDLISKFSQPYLDWGVGRINLSLFIFVSYSLKIEASSITSNDLIGIISEPYFDWGGGGTELSLFGISVLTVQINESSHKL